MGDKKALLILTSSNTTLSTKTQFCCLLLFADSVYKSVHHCTVRWLGCNVVQPAEDISLSTLYHCMVPLHDSTGYIHGYFLVVKNPKTKVCKRKL